MENESTCKFSLIHDQWIMVSTLEGLTTEVSTIDIFENGAKYKALAGELRTQDFSMLRFLLAILHGALGGRDIDGNPFPNEPEKQTNGAIELWNNLWRNGLPVERIRAYLDSFSDRFYLFHPLLPFYQIANLENGTEYSAAKLNSEVGESGNKSRIFSQRFAFGKPSLSFAEAARWLIHTMMFDDASNKPTQKKGLPSSGVGWLGQLGLISAVGDTLLQTLLLNLIFLPDGNNRPWEQGKAIWEISPRTEERVQITPPDSQVALLTHQSRRIRLFREGNVVTGYRLQGGDFFRKENCFTEQFTVWKNISTNESKQPVFVPRKHSLAVQMWRDFSPLVEQSNQKKMPGIIAWLKRLHPIPDYPVLRFQITGILYGDKNSSIDDIIYDSLAFNAGLLAELDKHETGWVRRIIDELVFTRMLVDEVATLAENVVKADGKNAGNDPQRKESVKAAKADAESQAYYRLDQPFRKWLEALDPSIDDPTGEIMEEECEKWWRNSQSIVHSLGQEIVEKCSPQAYIGSSETLRKRGCKPVPEAYSIFMRNTKRRNSLRGGKRIGRAT